MTPSAPRRTCLVSIACGFIFSTTTAAAGSPAAPGIPGTHIKPMSEHSHTAGENPAGAPVDERLPLPNRTLIINGPDGMKELRSEMEEAKRRRVDGP